ncbi:ROK family protein [Nonomuraea basaltis]|uniref:ROK family protein n=1 Tax=Nonomuraea basaltis TaxID=2495887 RepID=UPI00110C56FF|nr:ROK family protein [Nonomuraea basaltis]TMR97603.1 ROK family protein [Nonomuraea basaltis]
MILAIDVGGTKMAAGLVGSDGTVAFSARVATPQGADAPTLWKTLDELIEPLSEGVEGVGVGCGGPMAWPDGEVSPLNIPGWRGFPLRARLAERFPGLPVRLHNDAICLAVAEHWKGAGQGSADMLGMVVSTGVGGGLILDGRLVNGGTGNAGHIGHVVVEPEGGPRCGCGGHGCLEAVARGPALTAWALDQGWVPGPAAQMADAGPRFGPDDGAYREDRAVTARGLAADARAGDPVAVRAMRRAGRALGIAIASATHLCDLDLVTIGGGLSQAGEPLFGPLDEALREHAMMGFARRVKVMPATLGQEAGLVGAAALILAGESYWTPATSR